MLLTLIPEDVVLPPPRNNCECGVYVNGQGSKATFTYWEIDLIACTFRRVWCVDLARGIRDFQAEHQWPE